MATLRYTDGPVTVTLDGALETFVREALEAAAGPCVRVLEDRAETVATAAESAWYSPGTGVRRDTGRSGDLDVVSTVSDQEARVAVHSSDPRMVGRKPLPVLVRRPSATSTLPVEISRAEYDRIKKSSAKSTVFRARADNKRDGVVAGRCYSKLGPNRWASDGKYLYIELVRKPGDKALKEALPALEAAFSAKVR